MKPRILLEALRGGRRREALVRDDNSLLYAAFLDEIGICGHVEHVPGIALGTDRLLLLEIERIDDGNVLPYFYLGTKSPVLVQSKNTIELTGGTWDKRVLTFAKDALKSMSYFTWTLKETSEAFEREGVDASNNKLVVSMSKDDKGKPYFKAGFQKVFAVPENRAWSEAIKTEMTKDFGEVLPYVYLAATDPECGEFYNGALEISGGKFDDQIYALAADAFTKAGYTVS